jgi:hypothetical protein
MAVTQIRRFDTNAGTPIVVINNDVGQVYAVPYHDEDEAEMITDVIADLEAVYDGNADAE